MGTSGVTQTRGCRRCLGLAHPTWHGADTAVCLSPDTHRPGWGPSSPARGAARTPTPSSPPPPSPRPVSLYLVSLGRHRAGPQRHERGGPCGLEPRAAPHPQAARSDPGTLQPAPLGRNIWNADCGAGLSLSFQCFCPKPKRLCCAHGKSLPMRQPRPPPYRGTSGTPEPGQGPTLAWWDMRVHTHTHVCSQKGTATAFRLPEAGCQSLPTLQRCPPLTQGPRGAPWGRRHEARVLPPRIPAICTQTLAC